MNSESIATIAFVVLAIYLACGLIFVIPFLIIGVNKIDEGSHESSWGFRVIIVPGVMVFWPVLLRKWIQHRQKNEEPGK